MKVAHPFHSIFLLDWILFNICMLISWVFLFFSFKGFLPIEALAEFILKAITVYFNSQHSILTHRQVRMLNWENFSSCWVRCFSLRIPGILVKVISQSFLQLNEIDLLVFFLLNWDFPMV